MVEENFWQHICLRGVEKFCRKSKITIWKNTTNFAHRNRSQQNGRQPSVLGPKVGRWSLGDLVTSARFWTWAVEQMSCRPGRTPNKPAAEQQHSPLNTYLCPPLASHLIFKFVCILNPFQEIVGLHWRPCVLKGGKACTNFISRNHNFEFVSTLALQFTILCAQMCN